MEPTTKIPFAAKKVREDLRQNYLPKETFDLLGGRPGDPLLFEFDPIQKIVIVRIPSEVSS